MRWQWYAENAAAETLSPQKQITTAKLIMLLLVIEAAPLSSANQNASREFSSLGKLYEHAAKC